MDIQKELINGYNQYTEALFRKGLSLPDYGQSGDGHVTVRYKGCPLGSTLKVVQESDRFRIYYRRKETLDSILMSGIRPAIVPYAQISQGSSAYYDELRGIFLTLPGVSPSDVGVPGKQQFVDVGLPSGLRLIQLKDNKHEPNIFLLPIQSDQNIDSFRFQGAKIFATGTLEQ